MGGKEGSPAAKAAAKAAVVGTRGRQRRGSAPDTDNSTTGQQSTNEMDFGSSDDDFADDMARWEQQNPMNEVVGDSGQLSEGSNEVHVKMKGAVILV